MIYSPYSLATSTNCFNEFSLKIKPVGLFGLIKQIATVFEEILERMSSISGIPFSKSTANSIGVAP